MAQAQQGREIGIVIAKLLSTHFGLKNAPNDPAGALAHAAQAGLSLRYVVEDLSDIRVHTAALSVLKEAYLPEAKSNLWNVVAQDPRAVWLFKDNLLTSVDSLFLVMRFDNPGDFASEMRIHAKNFANNASSRIRVFGTTTKAADPEAGPFIYGLIASLTSYQVEQLL